MNIGFYLPRVDIYLLVENLSFMQSQLEKRLIRLTYSICQLCNTLNKTSQSIGISGQLINSSADATLSFIDSQEAVLEADMVKKLIVVQEELLKTSDGLKLLRNTISANELHRLKRCQNECDQIGEKIEKFIFSIISLKNNNPHLVSLCSPLP